VFSKVGEEGDCHLVYTDEERIFSMIVRVWFKIFSKKPPGKTS